MNASAEKHLAKAEDYFGRGEGWYRKAAGEIEAAKAADPSLSNYKVAERLGRNESWVRRVLQWNRDASAAAAPTPFAEKEEPGSQARRAARQILRDAPLEQVEQIISELPKERQKQVAAAAGHEYLKARVDLDEEERNRTPAQRKEREAAAEALTEPARKAVAGFATLGIIGHIEQATDELTELVADSSLSPETLRGVLRADAAWRHELQVAAAMVGLEVDLQEVR